MITRRQMMKTLALGSTVLASDFIPGLGLAQAAVVPAASVPADLLQTFNAAKDAFNNRQWTELEKLLDPDVILNRVDDSAGSKSLLGKADVSTYLETDVAADKPQFTPTGTPKVNLRTGTVSGIAMWLDHDEDQYGNIVTTNRPISYSFSFTLRRPSAGSPRKWYLSNVYGSPD